MKAIDYAQAVYALKENETDIVVDGLVSVLKKRGAISLLPNILKEYEALLARKNAEGPTITIADESKKDEIINLLSKDIKESNPEIKVDASIIGGYVYKTKNILLDKSYKSALLGMYRNIIK
jgi:F0F1-type ATP synthase delta subunit